MKRTKIFRICLVLSILLVICGSLWAVPPKTILPEKLLEPTRNQIVFVGDSGTYGGNVVSAEDQTFPALIDKFFYENDLPYVCVNAGVNGDTTSGVLDRLEQYLNPRTALVVLDIGINDFFRNEPTEKIKERLSAIVNKIRSKNIGVFVFSFTLPKVHAERGVKFSQMFAELVRELALPTLEMLQPDWIENARKFSPDHTHYTEYGHSGIASQLLRLLNPKWVASPEELVVTEAMVRSIPYWVAREARQVP